MTTQLWKILNAPALSVMEVLIGAMIGALLVSWVIR